MPDYMWRTWYKKMLADSDNAMGALMTGEINSRASSTGCRRLPTPPPGTAVSRSTPTEMHHGRYRFILTLLVLPLALYGIFVVSPYLQAFKIALTNWQGMSPSYDYVGLDNFSTLFHDPLFWTAVRHNAFLLIGIPVIVVTLALFFATMLNHGGGVRGSRFYKVVYFFPSILSIAVVGVLWQFVYEPRNGLLNAVLRGVGLHGQIWLGDGNTALSSIMAVVVWGGVGFYVVLFTAAMAAIPRDLYEAALLDGANLAVVLAARPAVDLGQRADGDRVPADRRDGHVRAGQDPLGRAGWTGQRDPGDLAVHVRQRFHLREVWLCLRDRGHAVLHHPRPHARHVPADPPRTRRY